ncbi:glycoside hydrolase family 1 protein [Spiroplasma tabanidicola]|uniref:6-phospho-beta-glucosidase n=1 Tax=Spiroplasma tabanidicola TaxID=324079 RepID=A0A6I6CHX2_9MOLU|nr:glycoside hydrolase family 1 protein [Spiroplasma tabanidicola]QGS51653.1 6-phospho-beta-glucosidase [Spiroplasma tabanidicola]
MKDFLFSVSTCAFQIEGARSLGGRSQSIWDEFTKRNFVIPPIGKASREINSIEVAADFYHKYKTDARIMHKLGLNAFVYNMDWTRIYPKDENYVNPEGIKFYIDFFEEFNKKNIKPIPVLFHWDTPLWAEIRGGFQNKEIQNWFRNYARTCFKHLGKYTDVWFVSDENSTFSRDAYLSDYLPPQKVGKWNFVNAIHNLNMIAAVTKEEFELAKKEGYISKEAIIGVDHDWSPPIAFSEDIEDTKACERYNEWNLELYLSPSIKGVYPKVFFEYIKKNNLNFVIDNLDLEYLKKNKLDLIGWNYYRPVFIAHSVKKYKDEDWHIPPQYDEELDIYYVFPKKQKYTKWNWLINPDRIITGSQELCKIYGASTPLMILENGMGDFDNKSEEMIIDNDRINYLSIHLQKVLEAKKLGINFIGYSLWTYCDIYSPSGGYRKDYGLVSVDFNSTIRERKPKLSYAWYKKVIENKGNEVFFDIDTLKKELKIILDEWDLFFK